MRDGDEEGRDHEGWNCQPQFSFRHQDIAVHCVVGHAKEVRCAAGCSALLLADKSHQGGRGLSIKFNDFGNCLAHIGEAVKKMVLDF
jgi:hypothetical protein